jgi:hypothetical protein
MSRTTTCDLIRVAMSLFMVAVLAASAAATPLFPGATAFAVGEPDPTGGVLIAGGVPIPFATAQYSGTLTSSVILGDPSNPFGGLTFTYLLTNDVTSTGEIERLTVNDYMGFLTDVSYQIPTLSTIPTLNNRSIAGDVLGFTFIGAPLGAGTLTPGSVSALLVIQTDAPAFAPTIASVIDGTVASVPSFGPLVPEPSTWALLAAGSACLLAVEYLRRRNAPSQRL